MAVSLQELARLVLVSQTTDPAAAAQPNCMDPTNLTSLLPIVAMIAIFYFLIIRPQQKQQKELKAMRESLKRDDRIVTSGGIHGVVSAIKGDIVSVRIADGVKVDVDRSAIAVIEKGSEGEQ